jgi:hypothetical protein
MQVNKVECKIDKSDLTGFGGQADTFVNSKLVECGFDLNIPIEHYDDVEHDCIIIRQRKEI